MCKSGRKVITVITCTEHLFTQVSECVVIVTQELSEMTLSTCHKGQITIQQNFKRLLDFVVRNWHILQTSTLTIEMLCKYFIFSKRCTKNMASKVVHQVFRKEMVSAVRHPSNVTAQIVQSLPTLSPVCRPLNNFMYINISTSHMTTFGSKKVKH